jgi:hypothetical protein
MKRSSWICWCCCYTHPHHTWLSYWADWMSFSTTILISFTLTLLWHVWMCFPMVVYMYYVAVLFVFITS